MNNNTKKLSYHKYLKAKRNQFKNYGKDISDTVHSVHIKIPGYNTEYQRLLYMEEIE